MKIIKRSLFTLALGSLLITQTGCFGEFALVKKVYDWNDGVTDNKFVKSLVFFALCVIPVYELAGFLDAVVFNLIEFWSGTNPLAMEEGAYEMQLITMNGEQFKVETTKDTFTTTQLTGTEQGVVRTLRFDRCDNTWRYSDDEVCDQPLMTFLDDRAEHVRVHTAAGSVELTTAEMRDAGVMMAKFGPCPQEAVSCAR